MHRDRLGWYIGVSSYWFATSFKWFILFFLLAGQVKDIVPGGEANTWWGRIVMVGAIWAMIGPGLFGWLSDQCRSKFGRRRPFIAIGGALTTVALLFLGAANQVWMFFVGYLLLQVADDLGTGPYSAIVPEFVPAEHRGKASGIMGLLKLVAQLAAAVAGIVFGSQIMTMYAVMAGLNIVCAIWTLYTIRQEPAYNGPKLALEGSIPQRVRTFWKPFAQADFRWIWITSFLNAFGFYMILVYLRNYLQDKVLPQLGTAETPGFVGTLVGNPLVATILIAVVISIVGAFSSVIGGKLADKHGRKRVVIRAGWLMFISLVPFALVPNYWMIMALSVPFGIGYGAYLSSDWALVSDVLGGDEGFGRNMGLWQMSVATPQVISGGLGLLVDSLNQRYAGQYYGYSIIFIIASVGFLLGSTLISRVKGST